MGSNNMLLVAISLLFFGKLVVSSNEMKSDRDVTVMETEAITTAASLANSMLDRATVKRFDEKVLPGNSPSDSSAFSLPIGLDGTEVSGRDSTFDDIDDYNGYKDSVATPRFGKFYISCSVYYVNETEPFDSVGVRKFMKNIDVSVSNNFMVDATNPLKLPVAVRMSRLVSYR